MDGNEPKTSSGIVEADILYLVRRIAWIAREFWSGLASGAGRRSANVEDYQEGGPDLSSAALKPRPYVGSTRLAKSGLATIASAAAGHVTHRHRPTQTCFCGLVPRGSIRHTPFHRARCRRMSKIQVPGKPVVSVTESQSTSPALGRRPSVQAAVPTTRIRYDRRSASFQLGISIRKLDYRISQGLLATTRDVR